MCFIERNLCYIPTLGQLICFFSISVPFRSIPVPFNWTEVEKERNGNGTGMERDWNRNGTEMEQEWSGNGIGTELELNGNGKKGQ